MSHGLHTQTRARTRTLKRPCRALLVDDWTLCCDLTAPSPPFSPPTGELPCRVQRAGELVVFLMYADKSTLLHVCVRAHAADRTMEGRRVKELEEVLFLAD